MFDYRKSGFRIFGASDERGQNIVEFALMAPIIIMLFMGMFDFGWILHKQISLDNAVRAGARRAAIGQNNTAVKNVIKNECNFPVIDSQITVDVLDANGNSIGNPNDRTPDHYFHVEVHINDVQLITPLNSIVPLVGQINLHAESDFLIE